jgi:hypothetical protein
LMADRAPSLGMLVEVPLSRLAGPLIAIHDPEHVRIATSILGHFPCDHTD